MNSQLSSLSSATDESNGEASEISTECSYCHALGYVGDRFCACCGRPVIRKCTACGSQILHPVAHYCSSCGASLTEKIP